jgi:hypothetical protein
VTGYVPAGVGVWMVIAALPVAVVAACVVAVTVTTPGGTAVGAVYVAVFIPVDVTESFVPLAVIAQVTA